ncbi:MAG: ATP-binding protein [Spirochaetes bacterium]|nr:ATP-binding protein [Spirochaetota bacterium]
MLKFMPVVAILGPRQCGKSTLAMMYSEEHPNIIRLDLERPADLARLEDPESFFKENKDSIICIDEIQRTRDLFPVIRYTVDQTGKPGQFLILGSASKELIRQSSESLAGRIAYLELTPFLWPEINETSDYNNYLNRGGFPRSFLAGNPEQSFEWRINFIRDLWERDIPALGFRFSVNNRYAQNSYRFLQMLAHMHGQILNMSVLAGSLGIDNKTVRLYIDLLEGAFIVRRLKPYFANLKKRIVKSPKIYIRDTGILHALLAIPDWNTLAGHPVFGASWESLCIENIIPFLRPEVQYSFYRTAKGAEIDLVLEAGNKRMAVEFKVSSVPKVQRGFWNAMEDLEIENAWVIAPIETGYVSKGIHYTALLDFLNNPANSDFFK